MSDYSFLTTWCLDAPRDAVWDAIWDSERWPRWWRGVTAAEKLVEGEATGELAGTGRWRLFAEDGETPVTAVVYEWNVHTTKPWMNAAS